MRIFSCGSQDLITGEQRGGTHFQRQMENGFIVSDLRDERRDLKKKPFTLVWGSLASSPDLRPLQHLWDELEMTVSCASSSHHAAAPRCNAPVSESPQSHFERLPGGAEAVNAAD